MKITAYTWICLILLGLGMASCGSSKKPLDGANTSILDTNVNQELFVWVENARVRKQPDLKADIITEIKGGEKVILTGETSDHKIKVKLRGVDFEDVWVKVKTTDGKEGWIFKGMLTDDEIRAQAMNDFMIIPARSVGRVNVADKKEDVERIFGEQFVQEGEIFFPEGMSAKGFYVFKNSPLELQCVTGEETGMIATILIRQPGSNWKTAEGVKIGTKLDELAKMNGKPISFSGFGWDYGGTILSFNNGKLANYDGNLGILLGEPDNIEGLDEFMGDTDCSTSNKKIMGKGVKVAEISVFEGPFL